MYCLINWQKSLDMRRPIQTTTREIVKHFPFVLIALLFCIFVFLNGGIVLGDRNAHKPILHLPQLFYFSSFILFRSLPILGSNIVKNNDRSPFYQIATHKFMSLLILIFSLVCVKYFTYSYPYLLTDNRHFTFYLWRRWFIRNWFNVHRTPRARPKNCVQTKSDTLFGSERQLPCFVLPFAAGNMPHR